MQRVSRFLKKYLLRNKGRNLRVDKREREGEGEKYSVCGFTRLMCPLYEKGAARSHRNKSERPWNFRELASPLF